MKKRTNIRLGALALALVMALGFIPLVAPIVALADELDAPAISNSISGSAPTMTAGGTQVNNISWAAVDDAESYVLYVFEDEFETDTSLSLRQHPIPSGTTIGIPNFASSGNMPFMPLPDGTYYFRVGAIAASSEDNSPLSNAIAIRPGRRATPVQAKEMIDATGGNNSGKFIVLDVRNAYGVGTTGGAIQSSSNGDPGTYGTDLTEFSINHFTDAIIIPWPNAGLASPAEGLSLAERQANFFKRMEVELPLHPNWEGEDTLIFMY